MTTASTKSTSATITFPPAHPTTTGTNDDGGGGGDDGGGLRSPSSLPLVQQQQQQHILRMISPTIAFLLVSFSLGELGDGLNIFQGKQTTCNERTKHLDSSIYLSI